ncbi:MAG: OmpW family outer membrane protein [Candidatus Electrothrix aestuarii]|uniref:OmpW family outer membrane protein n=1 Tax=Candidatus Electrothrix aestuarii TaxID=3062594 RepID=A0AAU8LY34_9BACT|nr:OmpW family outer membrane protein [Candidatus Electrothrix aestuarii]
MHVLSKFGVAAFVLGMSCGMGSTVMAAHSAGDVLLRVGAVTVMPDSESSAVTNLPDGVDDARVSVEDDTQLSLTATYMLTNNLGLELLAATPFTHDIVGEGDIEGVAVGETMHLPPTLSLQYHFGSENGIFNPYVGVGLNVTMFFDEEVDGQLVDTLNTLPTIAALGGISSVDMELDPSVGIAAQAGVDVKVAENWYLNAAVWYIDISTTAELTTDLGTTHEVDVDIDPWVVNVAVAYKF